MTRKKLMSTLLFVGLGLVGLCCAKPSASAAPTQYVIVISMDGLGGTYLESLLNGTARTAEGDAYGLPNFQRLLSEGASTMYAHIDNDTYETVPNHAGMLTGRPLGGEAGHGWNLNDTHAAGTTIHTHKSQQLGADAYVSSVFDVAAANGLRTGLYANKEKFSIFPDSYAIDHVFINNGSVKDQYNGSEVVNAFIAQQTSGDPDQFAFVHINDLDNAGHNYQWGSTAWNEQVVAVDSLLGKIFQMIADVPGMAGNTAIILTADHGDQDLPNGMNANRFSVPFFVWGPGVTAGDLYELNADTRRLPDTWPLTTYDGVGPIRSLEACNLALALLGLEAIPDSVFGASHDLRVPEPATMSLLLLGGLAMLRRRNA
ncbi:MAG: alkaline phosphatase family protein [Phycisphaerae bacterium]|nr:alkaline phosphatase family protein [Phycisphaerae bacterium]